MNKLRYAVVGPDGPRTKWMRERIGQVLRAATTGRSSVALEVESIKDHDLLFFLGGICNQRPEAVMIDLSATGCIKPVDQDFYNQPALLELAIAGVPIVSTVADKIKNLDAEGLSWATINSPEPSPNNLTEDQVFEKPELLDKVSHVLMFSDNGRPLLCERLVMSRGCLVFMDGVDSRIVDKGSTPIVNGLDGFLNLCEAVAQEQGGSTKAFRLSIAQKAFSEDAVSARNARALIGSTLRKKLGTDFGLLDLHVAQDRLVTAAKRNLDK